MKYLVIVPWTNFMLGNVVLLARHLQISCLYWIGGTDDATCMVIWALSLKVSPRQQPTERFT